MRFLFAVLLSAVMASTAAFAGDIKIEKASTLEMPEGLPTAGVFMMVTNGGAADKLVSAKTDVAESAMLHAMDVDEKTGALMMKDAGGFEVAQNGTLAMAPGGNHVMLMGMKRQLKKGETFPLTLVFEKAGEIKVDVEVIATAEMGNRFPPELSNDVINKMVAVKEKLGKAEEPRSRWDIWREKIRTFFGGGDDASADAAAGSPSLPTREELESRIKMEEMAKGQGASSEAPVDAAPVVPAPPAPIATDPVDPEPVQAPESTAPAPAPAAPSATPDAAHHNHH